ncbi:cuticle protein 10.9-like [Tropilaelaps mercedesae]|uniref:Cuticle protein 10.9-like n=1 Tax=Tropilaelaps mercedesae TaxID=418985 RepID=A0A1V9WZ80_9ACAR|nr:cuticle protein 10.9-like [Tropilaelaps mercedesae]
MYINLGARTHIHEESCQHDASLPFSQILSVNAISLIAVVAYGQQVKTYFSNRRVLADSCRHCPAEGNSTPPRRPPQSEHVLLGFVPLPVGNVNTNITAYSSAGGRRPATRTLALADIPTLNEGIRYPPVPPYTFDYVVSTAEGNHGRRESGNCAGKVSGSYTIQLADGRSRAVKYRADETGYRAKVRSNEFGTDSRSPADVALRSSARPPRAASLPTRLPREATLLDERDSAFRRQGLAYHKKT